MRRDLLAARYAKSAATPMCEVASLRSARPELIDLSLGDPDQPTDEEVIKEAFDDVRRGYTHYSDPLGDPELRTAVTEAYRDDYGVGIDGDSLMVTASGCHALWLVLESVLNPGDEVIVVAPYFTPYPDQVRLAGGIPVFLETTESNSFLPTAELLERCVTPHTRAVIINSPSNPTGSCVPRDLLIEICELVRSRDLLLISDEIYTAFSYREPFSPVIQQVPDYRDRIVTINSFSKDYAMTGWRVGIVVGDPMLVGCMKNINEGNVFSASSVAQRAALAAIRRRSRIKDWMHSIYSQRVKNTCPMVNDLPCLRVNEPEGGMYLWVDISGSGLNDVNYVNAALRESEVLLLPGSAFGKSYRDHVRISLTSPQDILTTAITRLGMVGYVTGLSQ